MSRTTNPRSSFPTLFREIYFNIPIKRNLRLNKVKYLWTEGEDDILPRGILPPAFTLQHVNGVNKTAGFRIQKLRILTKSFEWLFSVLYINRYSQIKKLKLLFEVFWNEFGIYKYKNRQIYPGCKWHKNSFFMVDSYYKATTYINKGRDLLSAVG